MIELTEQEKCVILDIAKRTSMDVDGDILEIFVNEFTGDVVVVDRPMMFSECEMEYIRHDRKVTADLLKNKTWFDRARGAIVKMGRGNGRHENFYF